jgi:Flp pilus assembly protein TadG
MVQAVFHRWRHPARRRAASVVVEAALVLPIMFLLFLGILEYGRWLMTQHVMNTAANAGAHYACTHTSTIYLNGATYGNATSNVTSAVTNCLNGQQLIGQTINVFLSDALGNNLGSNWTSAMAGQYITVQITGSYKFALAAYFGMPSSMNVSFQTTRQSEGN